MFERRLWSLLLMFTAVGVVLAGRLIHIQIGHGDYYTELADQIMLRPETPLPSVRGRILDRIGRVLAADEPAVDLTIHYCALSLWRNANAQANWTSTDQSYLDVLNRRLHAEPQWRSADKETLTTESIRRIDSILTSLSEISGTPRNEIAQRANTICERVERLRRHLYDAWKGGSNEVTFLKDVRLAEQVSFHPILRGITPELRAQLEVRLGREPYVRLEPAVRRVYDVPPAMMHIVGRLGQVSHSDIRDDPLANDDLARYRAGDLHGVSGVEALAEDSLRGKRGEETTDLDGNVIEQTPPQDGGDISLTIDSDLQNRIYNILERAVAEHPLSTGAAAVVISVPQREVLAMVSYPGFDDITRTENYPKLRDDTLRRPLWPRAAAVEYPPGSIIKPGSLIAAISNRSWTSHSTILCRGQLDPDVDAWRCWTFWRGMAGHGSLDAVGAIQHSCNVYFYRLGDAVGPEKLTDGLRLLLYGPEAVAAHSGWQGTGLIEERSGLIPTPESINRPFRRADARNYAIGQGELQITPLQASNLMATIATGNFLSPALVLDPQPRVPQSFNSIPNEAWRTAREGLYRCVNIRGGTAFDGGRSESVVICGKTGSAESVRRVITRNFVYQREDGTLVECEAPTIEAARERLNVTSEMKLVSRKAVDYWPSHADAPEAPPTHAWFAGYAPRDKPRIAVSVVIEFGGGGGKVAAPVARRIIETTLLGENTSDDAPVIATDRPGWVDSADNAYGGYEP